MDGKLTIAIGRNWPEPEIQRSVRGHPWRSPSVDNLSASLRQRTLEVVEIAEARAGGSPTAVCPPPS
jgi:hypothetical protein